MTAVTHGADPEALDLLADEMLHVAERIALVGRAYLHALTDLHWSGPDAERSRQQWAYLWLAVIRPTSMALATAAGDARANAQQQREASGGRATATAPAAASGSAPSDPATGTSAPDDGRRSLLTPQRIRDLLMEGPEIATMITAARAWVNGIQPSAYGLASDVLSNGSAIARGGGRLLTGASVVLDGMELAEAARNADAAGAVIPGTGLGLTVAGLAGVSGAGPAGAAWGVGTVLGGMANDAMTGTSYGEAFERRNEMAFDTLGAGGMLVVPGNLALAAWDVLTGGDEATDAPGGGGR